MPPKGWLRIAGYWSIRSGCQGLRYRKNGGIRPFPDDRLAAPHYCSIRPAMRPKDFRKERRPTSGRGPLSPAFRTSNRRLEQAENWLYGLHAVQAALANPNRKTHPIVLTARAAEILGEKLLSRVRVEPADV